MEKINLPQFSKTVREQNVNETRQLLGLGGAKFWSWGAHAFVNFGNKFLKFKVNGNLHKGHVYICVNGSDLYDVYLTSTQGNIKKEIKDIFFEDLVDRIDEAVEKIDKYIL